MWEWFKAGSWWMIPIAVCSVFILGIIIERAIYLYGSSINRDVFLATMQKCILAGDIPKAVKMWFPGRHRAASRASFESVSSK